MSDALVIVAAVASLGFLYWYFQQGQPAPTSVPYGTPSTTIGPEILGPFSNALESLAGTVGLYSNKVIKLAQAIAYAEGFGVPGKIPTLAHNPGDLVLGDLGYGTLGSQHITVLADDNDGWNRLYHQVNLMLYGGSRNYSSGMTFEQVGLIYAGAPEWAVNVGSFLGIDPSTTTLSDFANS